MDKSMTTQELDNLSLAELFTLADEIGDKYLTEEEIAERDRELAEAFALVELDGLSLAELFTLSDEIGDKYLTEEEIVERDRELAEAFALVDEVDEKARRF